MVKVKLECKFPCGYEIKFEASGFGLRDINGLPDLDKCPIHGKECKKGGKK